MIKFQSFLSGSSGNCTYITDDNTHILVDCGATAKYISACLGRLGVEPTAIDAILVTHEHRDHVSGAGVFARKYSTPIIATDKTWSAMQAITGKIPESSMDNCASHKEFKIGTIDIRPFAIPHDASEPVGYRLTDKDGAFTVATDLGHISDELIDDLSGSDSIIIEANHDLEMLRTGVYPYYLKRRILGEKGHLSNDACARLCAMLAQSGTKSFWLGHLSKENNTPTLAFETVREILKKEGFSVGTDVGLGVLPANWLNQEDI